MDQSDQHFLYLFQLESGGMTSVQEREKGRTEEGDRTVKERRQSASLKFLNNAHHNKNCQKLILINAIMSGMTLVLFFAAVQSKHTIALARCELHLY